MRESETDSGTHPTVPERSFMHERVLWRVRELPPPSYDRRSTGRLVFESEELVRVVRTYPRNWQALSRDELMALSTGT